MEVTQHQALSVMGAHIALRHVVQNLLAVLGAKEILAESEIQFIVSEAAKLCVFVGGELPEEISVMQLGADHLLTDFAAALKKTNSTG